LLISCLGSRSRAGPHSSSRRQFQRHRTGRSRGRSTSSVETGDGIPYTETLRELQQMNSDLRLKAEQRREKRRQERAMRARQEQQATDATNLLRTYNNEVNGSDGKLPIKQTVEGLRHVLQSLRQQKVPDLTFKKNKKCKQHNMMLTMVRFVLLYSHIHFV
jgi:hypothetical protein